MHMPHRILVRYNLWDSPPAENGLAGGDGLGGLMVIGTETVNW
jgi:hypothetical protein